MFESTLFPDPQSQPPADRCPICGGERYAPGCTCLRCEERWPTLKEMSIQYHQSATQVRIRLARLRGMLRLTRDPEELFRIRRTIAELTPVLTQLNELADLTEHYYDKGYWRSKKYTF